LAKEVSHPYIRLVHLFEVANFLPTFPNPEIPNNNPWHLSISNK
jgi:hypothetical protein